MSERRIGNGYHTRKFDKIMATLAEELVANTMGEYADSEKGREFCRQAEENLKQQFADLPVTFYQTLDAFADGRSVEEYVSCTDPRKKDFLKDVTFSDLVMACRDGRVVVKNETAALSYYERLFGLAAEQTDAASATEEDQRRRAVRAGKQQSEEYEDIGRRALTSQRSAWNDATLKGGREKRLGKRLIRYTEKLVSARGALLSLMPLEQLGLVNRRQQVKYRRLSEKVDALIGKVAQCREELDTLSRRQLENGEITPEAFMARLEILQAGAESSVSHVDLRAMQDSVRREPDAGSNAIWEPSPSETAVETAERKRVNFAQMNIRISDMASCGEAIVSETASAPREKKVDSEREPSQEG